MRLINVTTALGAVAVTAAAALSGCGVGDRADAASGYCKELKSTKTYFQSFQGDDPDLGALGEAFKRMHRLADIAPEDVADDWATIDHQVDAIEAAMKDAGVTYDDLAAMQAGELPEDLDPEKLTEVGSAFEALSGGDFDTAAGHIADHAKKSCGFVLPIA